MSDFPIFRYLTPYFIEDIAKMIVYYTISREYKDELIKEGKLSTYMYNPNILLEETCIKLPDDDIITNEEELLNSMKRNMQLGFSDNIVCVSYLIKNKKECLKLVDFIVGIYSIPQNIKGIIIYIHGNEVIRLTHKDIPYTFRSPIRKLIMLHSEIKIGEMIEECVLSVATLLNNNLRYKFHYSNPFAERITDNKDMHYSGRCGGSIDRLINNKKFKYLEGGKNTYPFAIYYHSGKTNKQRRLEKQR